MTIAVIDFSGYQIRYLPSLMYSRAHSGSRNHHKIVQTLLLVNETDHNMLRYLIIGA